jgi:cardiolipin synthase A/B
VLGLAIQVFGDFGVWFVVEWALRALAIAVVPPRRSPQSASAWMLLIFLFPIVGFPLFLVLGRARAPAKVRRRRADFPGHHAGVIQRLDAQLDRFAVPPDLLPTGVARLSTRLGRFRPVAGNHVEWCADYDGCIRNLIADIDAAQDHVHLLYYIWGADEVGAQVEAALMRAAARGVTCRVLADAFGTARRGRRCLRRLRRDGIRTAIASPMNVLRAFLRRADMRNHRKIAVIDGRVAHVGSQNIVKHDFRKGLSYEDLNVRATGPVVLQLQIVFLSDWHAATGEPLDVESLLPDAERTGDCVAQALPSGPSFPDENFRRVLVDLLHGARERVTLVTPYFVPDESTMTALTTASLRGVKVRVIVPRRHDSRLVGLAQDSYVAELVRDGVRVHRYLPAFLHAKHATIDERIALIGSGNIDVRSFSLNEEISLLLYDRAICASLHEEQERLLRTAPLVDLDRWLARPFFRHWVESIARLFSPML